MTDDSREQNTYECVDCETRVKAPRQPGECPNCGGVMENISVPKE